MAFLYALPGAIAEGLIWGLMGIGVYISYKILDIADLTVDGSICTGACVCAVLLGLGVPVWISVIAAMLAGALAGVVPDLADTAMQGMGLLEQWLLGLISRAPDSISPLLSQSVEGLFSDGTALLDQLATRLLGLASGIVSRLPDSALGLFTWLLASYMISAKLPNIRRWIGSRLPEAWQEKTLPMLQRLKRSVAGWLKAQLKLMGITFGVLTVGFFLLRITYAPVWAILIALVDALPVLGSGMVLIPWSVVCFLQGNTVRGIGLLGVYAAAALLRSVLEPRLVGKQLGLDPLLTLLCLYAGYRIWGIAGMVLAPLLATAAKSIAQPKPAEN